MLRRLVLLAVFSAALDGAQVAPEPPQMTDPISTAVSTFNGLMGVAATNLATGEEILVNADLRFPTASAIKTAVMVEAYRQAATEKLRLDAPLTLREADKVGGSGVLNGLRDGLTLTVADLIHLMIVVSDNTATNLLVNKLGVARINEGMVSLGFVNTKIFRPTFRDGRAEILPDLEKEFGLGMATPRDMARLMALIADGKAVSAEASAAMMATLRRQQDRAMIPRLLPPGLQIGNKTGTDQEKLPGKNGVRGQVRVDAAIVTGPNVRYAIAIFARHVEDRRGGVDNDALVTGARVSRMVYDHFAR